MNNPIVWHPQNPESSQMWHFMRFVEQHHPERFSDYTALHAWSVQYPARFWEALCQFYHLRFDKPPAATVNTYRHPLEAQWFQGAHFNVAEKLLSRNDDHLALIEVNERGDKRVFTYRELQHHVSSCAAGLKAAGVTTGDRVAAVMPNVAYTVIAMLATASIGAIWSSCSTDFGAQAAIDRLGQITPKILFVSDGHQYQGKTHSDMAKTREIVENIPSIEQVIICPAVPSTEKYPPLANATAWNDFIRPDNVLQYAILPFSHPLYILFSSGTTGKPKCIVHGAGGTLLQHLKELGLHTDLTPEDNLLFHTTCGWMMWNWMVSALALGTTLTLYDG